MTVGELQQPVGVDKGVAEASSVYYERRALQVIKNFEKKNIHGYYARDRQEALAKALELIPEGSTVGRADSVTLLQIGLIKVLRNGKYNFIDPFPSWDNGHNPAAERHLGPENVEEWYDEMKRAMLADIFVTGVNAITIDGQLVATDGRGNRVAAMLFGPKKVVVVSGANKIVPDLPAALRRVKEIAAPMVVARHAQRHPTWLSARRAKGQTPCEVNSVCNDCRSPLRVCRSTIIMEAGDHHELPSPRLHVIIVGCELGL